MPIVAVSSAALARRRSARVRLCLRAVAVAGILCSGCSSPLPEANSAAAQLYAQRCGTCHAPYKPGLLTPKMWETMVARMEAEMARRGVELSANDKAVILEYLQRNAGAT